MDVIYLTLNLRRKNNRIDNSFGAINCTLPASGLSGKFAQSQAGHEDSSTTYNIYAQNNKDGIHKAMDVLNNMFVEKCEQERKLQRNFVHRATG